MVDMGDERDLKDRAAGRFGVLVTGWSCLVSVANMSGALVGSPWDCI